MDPDTRHAHKTQSRQQDGFKAHIVIEPDTGLITAAELTKASGPESSDGAVAARLIGIDPTIAGTSSGEMLTALAGIAHTPVIKPWPLRPAVEGGFTLDELTVDESAGTATCPNGITRNITVKRRVTFGAACTGCPFRDRCTSSPRARKLDLHEHDALQREHRQRAADPAFRDAYRTHRPMVERSSPGAPAATDAFPTAASAGQRLAAVADSRTKPAPPPRPGTASEPGITGAGITHRRNPGPSTKTAGWRPKSGAE